EQVSLTGLDASLAGALVEIRSVTPSDSLRARGNTPGPDTLGAEMPGVETPGVETPGVETPEGQQSRAAIAPEPAAALGGQ
ncbi:MAG: hypothetical protein KA159_03835, partial [Halioglobus sp.]|nr:hypothetical protein [Halioglobus sp.]